MVNGVGTAKVAIACCSMPDYCNGIAIGSDLETPWLWIVITGHSFQCGVIHGGWYWRRNGFHGPRLYSPDSLIFTYREGDCPVCSWRKLAPLGSVGFLSCADSL